MANKERVIEEFLQLTSIDSISGQERQMADILTGKLRDMEYEVFEDNAGESIGGTAGNLICTIKGTKKVPAIILAAHMDTVEPGKGKKPRIDGDYIRSDGTTVLGADDVAGIVGALEALRVIKENNLEHGDIQLVFTISEENGLNGSKALDYSQINANYGFVLDTGGPIGTVSVKAPSHNSISVAIKGRAAHAGNTPEEGVSAIQIAAKAIAGMKLGRLDFETTANVGVISGGHAANIICDKVDIKAEARSRNEEKLQQQTEHMKMCFEQAAAEYGGSIEFTVKEDFKTYSIAKDSPIISILRKAAEAADVPLSLEETGGGSDTNIFNLKGIQSVNISMGMEKVHTVKECILIDNLVKAAEFVLSIIINIE